MKGDSFMEKLNNKLVLAVLQEDDYEATVSALNEHGYFVTKLSSSGGFLKKKSITILVGVDSHRYVELMDLLKGRAGKRSKTVYTTPTILPGAHPEAGVAAAVPIQVETGGVTVFTMSLDGLDKF